MNEKERAIAALEKSYEDREAWIAWLGVEPVFDRLRDDVRFTHLLERSGNPLVNRGKTIEMNLADTSADKIQTTDADNPNYAKPARFPAKHQFLKRAFAAADILVVITGIAFFAMRFGWRKGWNTTNKKSQRHARRRLFFR